MNINRYIYSSLLTSLVFVSFDNLASRPSYNEVSEITDFYQDVLATDTQIEYTSILPFFREKAQGYNLPLPLGVNINHINFRQKINVDDIRFTGLKLGSNLLDNTIKINVGNTQQRSQTETLKLDAWLLPFMNIYGLMGYTEGHSISNIDVGICLPALTIGMITPDSLQNLKFRLDFKGTSYGIGTTFFGGVSNWFASVDTNYTQTHFDVLDGSIKAFTFSPRMGYRFTVPAIESFHLPSGKMNFWIGSMYQEIQQEFKGNLNELTMPSILMQQMVNTMNKNGNGQFEVKQRLKNPWNMLIGVQYEISQHFNISSELGFAERNSFFIAGEYRF